jgi:hypothetical protein
MKKAPDHRADGLEPSQNNDTLRKFPGPFPPQLCYNEARQRAWFDAARSERIREGKEVTAMTGFEIVSSLLIVTFVSTVLFAYIWLRTHEVMHTTHPHVDKMAGDEGEDW